MYKRIKSTYIINFYVGVGIKQLLFVLLTIIVLITFLIKLKSKKTSRTVYNHVVALVVVGGTTTVGGLATPKADINTLTTVTKKIPIIVKLFILFAMQISLLSFTLYLEFHIKPTPTATCNKKKFVIYVFS